MSTPTDEIAIDIDALDAAAAKTAADNVKKTTNGADPEPITVEKTDPDPKSAAKTIVTAEEGVEALKKQLADEKALRQAADQRANEAAQGEAKARGDVQTTQLDLIKGAIEQLTQTKGVLKAKLSAAQAAQDFDAAAEAQWEMADTAAKLAQLDQGKIALERAPKPVPRAPADPVEQFCAQLSGASAAWVRAHPEFVRDGHKNRQMIAAHEIALARGHKADTEDYFKSIEKTLDLTPAVTRIESKPDDADDPMAAAAQPVQRGAPAAAPVSRSGNGVGGRPNVVKLSPAEVEIASNMGMTVEEYARNKVALRKEGKLS